LGFALLLKFFELEARFPREAGEIPSASVLCVAEPVKVGAAVFELYDDWSGRAVERHRVQIRGVFGFRDFSRGDEDKLADWLAAEVCPVELRDEQLREALLVRCRAERIEPPRRVDRIVAIVCLGVTVVGWSRPGCFGSRSTTCSKTSWSPGCSTSST
jgi:hypothetical protein